MIGRLPYFMACTYEAARLFPPIPIFLRFVTPSEGVYFPDGRFVPGGTALGAAAAAVNRNESIFGPNADDWCPERWLSDSEQVMRIHRTLSTC